MPNEEPLVQVTENEVTQQTETEPITSAVETSTENPPAVEASSAFEDARQSVIAEYQPQLDTLRNENETLKHTIEQYKNLLKGTERSESAPPPEPMRTPVWRADWHRKDK